jgi:16S rRNA C967 or C1407 C5-methylase (RsmB/RsmF family)
VNCHPYPVQVPWLDGYYALPRNFNLHKSVVFQLARIYGQDVSSGAAVVALLSNEYDIVSPLQSNIHVEDDHQRVLDLCCCPGLKLCAVADTFYTRGKKGAIVGVDISKSRMAVCKNILHKYQIHPSMKCERKENDDNSNDVRIQLFCNDGTSFATLSHKDLNLVFDSVITGKEEVSRRGKRKRMNKSARARQEKSLKESDLIVSDCADTSQEATDSVEMQLFDRVLVDAECSTDGSVVHVQKRSWKATLRNIDNESTANSPGQNDSNQNFRWSDTERLSELLDLQKKLASSGFRLLRKGGYMVYSTCSLSKEQNEGVVQWLLNQYADARIVPVNFFSKSMDDAPLYHNDLVQQGTIPGTFQFLPNLDTNDGSVDPSRLFGGGFYLAKIRKV